MVIFVSYKQITLIPDIKNILDVPDGKKEYHFDEKLTPELTDIVNRKETSKEIVSEIVRIIKRECRKTSIEMQSRVDGNIIGDSVDG